MKEMQVRSEFKVHHSILFLDKYDNNSNKFLLSLGYDQQLDASGNPLQRALVFKIWEFVSLDNYLPAKGPGSLTGGTIWEKA